MEHNLCAPPKASEHWTQHPLISAPAAPSISLHSVKNSFYSLLADGHTPEKARNNYQHAQTVPSRLAYNEDVKTPCKSDIKTTKNQDEFLNQSGPLKTADVPDPGKKEAKAAKKKAKAAKKKGKNPNKSNRWHTRSLGALKKEKLELASTLKKLKKHYHGIPNKTKNVAVPFAGRAKPIAGPSFPQQNGAQSYLDELNARNPIKTNNKSGLGGSGIQPSSSFGSSSKKFTCLEIEAMIAKGRKRSAATTTSNKLSEINSTIQSELARYNELIARKRNMQSSNSQDATGSKSLTSIHENVAHSACPQQKYSDLSLCSALTYLIGDGWLNKNRCPLSKKVEVTPVVPVNSATLNLSGSNPQESDKSEFQHSSGEDYKDVYSSTVLPEQYPNIGPDTNEGQMEHDHGSIKSENGLNTSENHLIEINHQTNYGPGTMDCSPVSPKDSIKVEHKVNTSKNVAIETTTSPIQNHQNIHEPRATVGFSASPKDFIKVESDFYTPQNELIESTMSQKELAQKILPLASTDFYPKSENDLDKSPCVTNSLPRSLPISTHSKTSSQLSIKSSPKNNASSAFSQASERRLSRSPRRSACRSPKNIVNRSPRRRVSRSPKNIVSRSPRRRVSRSPKNIVSRSPRRRVSRSPRRRFSRSPKYIVSRSPRRRVSRSPRRRFSRSPKRRFSRSPRRRISRSPRRRFSRSPRREGYGSPRRDSYGSPRRDSYGSSRRMESNIYLSEKTSESRQSARNYDEHGMARSMLYQEPLDYMEPSFSMPNSSDHLYDERNPGSGYGVDNYSSYSGSFNPNYDELERRDTRPSYHEAHYRPWNESPQMPTMDGDLRQFIEARSNTSNRGYH